MGRGEERGVRGWDRGTMDGPLYILIHILLLLLHDYTLPTLSIMEIESCAPRLIYFFLGSGQQGRSSRGVGVV
jgi:hypothetical protein